MTKTQATALYTDAATGELARDLQPQLLRVLDKREVRRVGETRAIGVDIGVIAACRSEVANDACPPSA